MAAGEEFINHSPHEPGLLETGHDHRTRTRKEAEQAYFCIIACRSKSAAGDCCRWLLDEGEDIVKDLVDQGSAGAGSMKTVGIRLADFDDNGGGRGLLSESCLLEEKDGECFQGPDGLRLLLRLTARIDDDSERAIKDW
ncbi:uncharacterized protein M437DRAFT_74015 [Aureobasidium melanogenum CBS 110374]|uniref:Uncharacterized protein n=1 Tax=Aureobasidium melanogenum (strain CBS 110374) TaxID=1043003 RepID=A0A074VTS8_AURM1|nr:uncharacterized protein M437DRAFT_74015 [Aureobasidium melanogenum CBS 110374]KEQ64175.1 hypothetical protein M437DRAFT_74015 [Aureobasidium melanogenum CBS 110374]